MKANYRMICMLCVFLIVILLVPGADAKKSDGNLKDSAFRDVKIDYKVSNLITYSQNEGWGGIIPSLWGRLAV